MQPQPQYLHVGGVIAMGFDSTGNFLLVVSHSGCGVYAVNTWEKVGRNFDSVSLEHGVVAAIPPIEDDLVPVKQINFETGELFLSSPNNDFSLCYREGTIEIRSEST